jgi:hypothetical protein
MHNRIMKTNNARNVLNKLTSKMFIYFYVKRTSVWISSAMIAFKEIIISPVAFAIDVDNRTSINFILIRYCKALSFFY